MSYDIKWSEDALYYMELEIEKEIYIIRLLDNRQNPETIQEELDKY